MEKNVGDWSLELHFQRKVWAGVLNKGILGQWFSTGLAVPTGGHLPMTGDMFGCHAGAGVLLAPHGQRLEMLLNIL